MTIPQAVTPFEEELASILAPSDLNLGGEIPPAALHDWSTEPVGRARAHVSPRDTAQVSAIMAACHRHGVPVVPQGGLTGLTGAANATDGALLLSLARMNAIEEIDVKGATATVQAGVVLQRLQEAIAAEGMEFGLDLGPRGSCMIGGNIATNAGGNRVIRYGMTRDLVLGLEVVLADGTVLTMMNKMPKNNAALDLKPLFIGSEGTLGVITRAVVRLHPGIAGANTALVALGGFDDALELLAHARRALSDRVSAFELMWSDYLDAVVATGAARAPLAEPAPLYALIDMQGPDPDADAETFLAMLGDAMERGIVRDAAIAQSQREADAFWALRDGVAELLAKFRPVIAFDVSVPLPLIGACVERVRDDLNAEFPEMNKLFFGHAGDSNLHLMAGPLPEDAEGRARVGHRVEEITYGIVRDLGGSVSAEHGIGLHKKPWLAYSRSPAELALLRQLKASLDPKGILNPGKVL